MKPVDPVRSIRLISGCKSHYTACVVNIRAGGPFTYFNYRMRLGAEMLEMATIGFRCSFPTRCALQVGLG